MKNQSSSDAAHAASLTRAASTLTYFTIRLLVDRQRRPDAFRAYAYFRWLDDLLDREGVERSECLALLHRQRQLVVRSYRRDPPVAETPEEEMLLTLIRGDREPESGLKSYILHMMAVMAFDAERRGRLSEIGELADYSRNLAVAVTEALHHFVGHGTAAPRVESRYTAATAAHIAHLLRDLPQDVRLGYYNIPADYVRRHRMDLDDLDSDAYRLWVKSQVELARSYFKSGKEYLTGVENYRCRLAASLYIGQFERVLDRIERNDYTLRQVAAEPEILPAGTNL